MNDERTTFVNHFHYIHSHISTRNVGNENDTKKESKPRMQPPQVAKTLEYKFCLRSNFVWGWVTQYSVVSSEVCVTVTASFLTTATAG